LKTGSDAVICSANGEQLHHITESAMPSRTCTTRTERQNDREAAG